MQLGKGSDTSAVNKGDLTGGATGGCLLRDEDGGRRTAVVSCSADGRRRAWTTAHGPMSSASDSSAATASAPSAPTQHSGVKVTNGVPHVVATSRGVLPPADEPPDTATALICIEDMAWPVLPAVRLPLL